MSTNSLSSHIAQSMSYRYPKEKDNIIDINMHTDYLNIDSEIQIQTKSGSQFIPVSLTSNQNYLNNN